MDDSRLRQLERSFAVSQDRRVLSQLVRERLRLGLIHRDETLELASEFNNPLAIEIVGPIFYQIQNPILRLMAPGKPDDSYENTWAYSRWTSFCLFCAILKASSQGWYDAFDRRSDCIPEIIPRDFIPKLLSSAKYRFNSPHRDSDQHWCYEFVKDEILLDGYLVNRFPDLPGEISGPCYYSLGLLDFCMNSDWQIGLEMLFSLMCDVDQEELLSRRPQKMTDIIQEAEAIYCNWAFGSLDLFV